MSDLDFYAGVLLSERIAGIGCRSTANEIEAILAKDYIDDAQPKKWMRRDYGLIEFYFNYSIKDWICFGFSVQLHRLSHNIGLVPPSLVDRYGQFRPTVTLRQLVVHLNAHYGSPKLTRGEHSSDFGFLNMKGKNSYITAIREDDISEGSLDRRFGNVWSIDVRSSLPAR